MCAIQNTSFYNNEWSTHPSRVRTCRNTCANSLLIRNTMITILIRCYNVLCSQTVSACWCVLTELARLERRRRRRQASRRGGCDATVAPRRATATLRNQTLIGPVDSPTPCARVSLTLSLPPAPAPLSYRSRASCYQRVCWLVAKRWLYSHETNWGQLKSTQRNAVIINNTQ